VIVQPRTVLTKEEAERWRKKEIIEKKLREENFEVVNYSV